MYSRRSRSRSSFLHSAGASMEKSVNSLKKMLESKTTTCVVLILILLVVAYMYFGNTLGLCGCEGFAKREKLEDKQPEVNTNFQCDSEVLGNSCQGTQ